LLTRHPEAKPWIKRIIIMGGSVRVGYHGKPPPDREWNIRSDVRSAQILFRSGVPLVVAPLDATLVRFLAPFRQRVFTTRNAICQELWSLYELWDKQTPTLFDPVAVTLAFNESFVTMERLRIEVDDQGFTREAPGESNCRVATSIRAEAFLDWYVQRIVGWQSGTQGAVPCNDFDDKMGDPGAFYKAVIFNPVPGPPMGRNTRLGFAYRLDRADTLRIQIYSLSKGYHRQLTLTDEVRFQVGPGMELWMDDMLVYEASDAP
jgi:hypothetical protein